MWAGGLHSHQNPPHLETGWDVDWYTDLAWWLLDCHWGIRHGPWLAGPNIDWGKYNLWWILGKLQCIIGSHVRWKFLPFLKSHWQSPCTALMAGILASKMPALRAVQGDCERVYAALWPWDCEWQWLLLSLSATGRRWMGAVMDNVINDVDDNEGKKERSTYWCMPS